MSYSKLIMAASPATSADWTLSPSILERANAQKLLETEQTNERTALTNPRKGVKPEGETSRTSPRQGVNHQSNPRKGAKPLTLVQTTPSSPRKGVKHLLVLAILAMCFSAVAGMDRTRRGEDGDGETEKGRPGVDGEHLTRPGDGGEEEGKDKWVTDRNWEKVAMAMTVPAAAFGGMFMHTVTTGEEHLANSLGSHYTHGLHIIEKLPEDTFIRDFLNADLQDNGALDLSDKATKAYKQAFYDTTGDNAVLKPEYQWLEDVLEEAATKDPSMTIGTFRDSDAFPEYHVLKARLFDESEWGQMKELAYQGDNYLTGANTETLNTEELLSYMNEKDEFFKLHPEVNEEYISSVIKYNNGNKPYAVETTGDAVTEAAGTVDGVTGTPAEGITIAIETNATDALAEVEYTSLAGEFNPDKIDLEGSIPTSVDFTIGFLVLTIFILAFFVYWRLVGGMFMGPKLDGRVKMRGWFGLGLMATGLMVSCIGIADIQIDGVMTNYDFTTGEVDIDWSEVGRFNTAFIVGMMLIGISVVLAFFWKDEVMNGGRNRNFSDFLWPIVYSAMSTGIIGQTICFADAIAMIEGGAATPTTGYIFWGLSIITALLFTIALFKKELINWHNNKENSMSTTMVVIFAFVALGGGASLGSIIIKMDNWYFGCMGALAALLFIVGYKVHSHCRKPDGAGAGGILGKWCVKDEHLI